ncbi:hypothetical protein K435DRAFT_903768 [Dendrothele bispora CBS 962.96]|uniref:Uncharacterized protein n=1 Tax=Dendrothele bispora (strain CBS 962.96) TaxID=1314807 RepID=A0A4S8LUZ1_DENBC|nr:hypothetical protein K435DRAFT_903768 [Dendrothele bispora CBS 962.96]
MTPKSTPISSRHQSGDVLACLGEIDVEAVSKYGCSGRMIMSEPTYSSPERERLGRMEMKDGNEGLQLTSFKTLDLFSFFLLDDFCLLLEGTKYRVIELNDALRVKKKDKASGTKRGCPCVQQVRGRVIMRKFIHAKFKVELKCHWIGNHGIVIPVTLGFRKNAKLKRRPELYTSAGQTYCIMTWTI